jgi:hypothetical protein
MYDNTNILNIYILYIQYLYVLILNFYWYILRKKKATPNFSMFCILLFVLKYFFVWSLCCLFFFDLRILITPLVSSSSSYNNIVLHPCTTTQTYLTYTFCIYNILCIRCSTIETKEFARIGYNVFLFPHKYSGEGRGV